MGAVPPEQARDFLVQVGQAHIMGAYDGGGTSQTDAEIIITDGASSRQQNRTCGASAWGHWLSTRTFSKRAETDRLNAVTRRFPF